MTEIDGFVLGVDLGTSHTVAMLRHPDGRTRPLLFDGQPLLPSAVYLDTTGRLHVGADAVRLGHAEPGRIEPNPKRHVDDGSVLLGGGASVPVADLFAALLGAVAREAVATAGLLPPAILTHPAAWGAPRRGVLTEALGKAGWPAETRLVPEPVAAARYFAGVLRRPVPAGASLAVFDFGGGTLDVAVVRNEGAGPGGRPRFAVTASGGADDLGGLDLDAALVEHLGKSLAGAEPEAWRRLTEPVTLAEWRARRQFWEDVRGAKEMLSRSSFAPVPVPGVEHAVHLTRDELEAAVDPLVRRGVAEAASVIAAAGLAPTDLAGLFLVGGSSRVPMVARLLHSGLGIAPTVLEQPELPVAEGALAELAAPRARAVASVSAASSAAVAPETASAPTSGPGLPVSSVPVSPPGSPISAVPGMSVSPARPPEVRRPLYKRPVLWIAAAAVALAGVVTAVALVLLGNDEVNFQPVAEVGRIPSAEDQPYYVYTDMVGDRAYMAYERKEDSRLEIIAADPATAKVLWRVKTESVADRWDGITALPNAVIAFQSSSVASDATRDMAVHNTDNGQQMWHRLIRGDDRVYPFKDVLVLSETSERRLLGLDLRTGKTRWERPNPGKAEGLTGTAIHPVQTVADVTGPASTSGRPFAPVTDDQRFVQIGADRSATVIDATDGKELRKRTNVADPADAVVAYNGRLIVAAAEDGYRLSGYDLDTMGEPANLYTAPDDRHRLDVLAMCGEARACLLDSVSSDSQSTSLVAIDLEKGGELWRTPAPGADLLVHFDQEVVARATSGDYLVRVFDPDGTEILKREGAAGRVDAATMLLFDEISSSADDHSVAGLHAGSTEVIEMGQLKDVKTDSCSWNTTYIVCAGDTDFLVARFARD